MTNLVGVTHEASSVSRRLFLTGSLSAVVLGGLAACSGDNSDPAPDPKQAAVPAFPTTIDHVYGSTTINAAPQRIVVVGFTEQDALLALGVVPVATTQFVGDAPYGVFPWAVDKLGDAKPAVLESVESLQIGQITELKPDLILATNAGLSQESYEELTKLAPTIANSGTSGNDWIEPWAVQTAVIGQAVGKSAEAERLVADLTQRFADAAVAHPQFSGTAVGFVQAPYDDGSVIAWPKDLSEFLTDLGFTIPQSFDKFVSDDVAQAQIPGEDATVLNDAKVLIWGTDVAGDGADIETDKILGKLDAVKDRRSIYTGELLASAMYFNTVLSLPYVLDQLVPELERVLPA